MIDLDQNGPERNRYHMAEFMLAVGPYLPDDITTVHEYGCRHGSGVLLLRELGFDARGYDVNPGFWSETIERKIELIDEYADLVVALSLFESWQVQEPWETLKRVFNYCRYVGISVHEKVSSMTVLEDDIADRTIIHMVRQFPCYINNHHFYLLRGN